MGVGENAHVVPDLDARPEEYIRFDYTVAPDLRVMGKPDRLRRNPLTGGPAFRRSDQIILLVPCPHWYIRKLC